MVLHHVKHLNPLLSDIYRVLKYNGYLVLREHDSNIPGLNMIIDIEHILYDVLIDSIDSQKTKNMLSDTVYRSKNDWDNILKNNGFTRIGSIKQKMKNNPTNHYYTIYKKKKR